MQRILANAVAIFTLTLFTSATLLFFVELIIAKMMLPKFGGTPAVWNTCMVFFQAALLAGYAYAHKITDWLGLRRQAIAQVVLICVPLAFLPFGVSERWTPPGDQFAGFWVLWLLLITVGLPFFAISTSAPLLQRWFSETGHPAAKDPYFLYAASNVGSMIALLGYPIFVEPYLTLSAQSWFWLAGYLVLTTLTIGCAYIIWHSPAAKVIPAPAISSPVREAERELEPVTVVADEAPTVEEKFAPEPASKNGKRKKKKKSGEEWKKGSPHRDPDDRAETFFAPGQFDIGRPSLGRMLHWMALAFVPSSLMLGATSYLTTNLPSFPLLWIIPLSLYLLSFIIVFSKVPPFIHQGMLLALPVVLLIMLFAMAAEILDPMDPRGMRWLLVLHWSTVFLASMVCHGELARNRPTPRYLTGFYLCMSAGGVLGGLFNALAAPLIFNSVAEYPIVLVMACLLLPPPVADKPSKLNLYLDIGLAVALGLAALYALPKLIAATYDADKLAELLRDPGSMAVPLVSYTIIALALLAYGFTAKRGQRLNRWLDVALPLCLGILTAQLIATMPFKDWDITARLAETFDLSLKRLVLVLTYGLPVALCYGFAEQPIRLGLGVGAIFCAAAFSGDTSDVLHQERTFFGVLKVQERGIYRTLLHGTTMHGQQRTDFSQLPIRLGPLMAGNPLEAAWEVPYSLEEPLRATTEALTYYHRTGPIGQIYEAFCPPDRPCHVAFIGLGTGTMASYLEPNHNGTIYEIDAAVVRIAENPKYFTYLRDCRGKIQENGKPYRIELGDARLRLQDAPDGKYRAIVVDAFSSDAIPVHLITKEAIALYMRKLEPGGVAAIHISNRHLGLAPVLGNIARELGLAALQNRDPVEDGYPAKSTSDWVAIARQPQDLQPLSSYFIRKIKNAEGEYRAREILQSTPAKPLPERSEEWKDEPCWQRIKPRPSQKVWTDDFSNILGVLRWWQHDDD